MKKLLVACIAISTVFSMTACGAASSPTDPADVEEAEDAISKARLAATYEFGGEGRLNSLKLEKDGTFAGEEIITCIRAPCAPIAFSGRWTVGSRYLRLYADGQVARYTYSYQEPDLRLYQNGTLYAHLVKKVDACAAVRCAAGTKCVAAKDGTAKCAETCGGFTAKQCSNTNQSCVDDPSDSCDPNVGGEDCSGICIDKAVDACGGCPTGTSCQFCWGTTSCRPKEEMC